MKCITYIEAKYYSGDDKDSKFSQRLKNFLYIHERSNWNFLWITIVNIWVGVKIEVLFDKKKNKA